MSALFGKAAFWGVVVMVCLIALAVTCRNSPWRRPARWEKERRERAARMITEGPLAVLSIDGPAALIVERTRRRKGEPEGRQVFLDYVSAPSDQEWSRAATEHLRGIAGTKVTLQYPRRLRGEAVAMEAQPEVAAHGPVIGVVIGESGIECNLDLVTSGYCAASADAPDEYQAAAAAAKKAKRGVWSKP